VQFDTQVGNDSVRHSTMKSSYDQLVTATPVLTHTIKDTHDLTDLGRSIAALNASKTSLAQEHALLRAIILVPVGKSFVTAAEKVLSSATWVTSQKMKLQKLTEDLDEAITSKDFVKVSANFVELRVMLSNKEFRQMLTGHQKLRLCLPAQWAILIFKRCAYFARRCE
jgi:hypothetical protein